MSELNAIITGGTDGIGKAVILGLGRIGYNIITIGRSSAKSEILQTEFTKLNKGKLIAVSGDLLDDQTLENFIQQVNDNFSHIDLLINNAGMQIANDLLENADIAAMERMFKIHTIIPLKLYKTFYPKMKAQGSGMIINIISAVVHGWLKETYGPYTISKYAEDGLGKMMVKEASKHNIRVTNVILGGAETNIRKDSRPGYLQPVDVASVIGGISQSPKDVFITEIHLYPKVQLSN